MLRGRDIPIINISQEEEINPDMLIRVLIINILIICKILEPIQHRVNRQGKLIKFIKDQEAEEEEEEEEVVRMLNHLLQGQRRNNINKCITIILELEAMS